jgi:hypothetical protein
MKEKQSDSRSSSDLEKDKGNYIIDVEPSSIITTTNIHLKELEDPEEGELLLHSNMWVKGTPLHLIVDNGSQNNLILNVVRKILKFTKIPYPQPYTIGWLIQG